MDNFRLDITCEGRERLMQAMALAFHDRGGGGAVGYVVKGEVPAPGALTDWSGRPKSRRLVFFWTLSPDAQALPFKLDAEGAADFAWRWLQQEDFGGQPDHDGDNGRGWRLYNEAWGHVDSDNRAFVAICPAWAMYGK